MDADCPRTYSSCMSNSSLYCACLIVRPHSVCVLTQYTPCVAAVRTRDHSSGMVRVRVRLNGATAGIHLVIDPETMSREEFVELATSKLGQVAQTPSAVMAILLARSRRSVRRGGTPLCMTMVTRRR